MKLGNKGTVNIYVISEKGFINSTLSVHLVPISLFRTGYLKKKIKVETPSAD